MSILFFALVGIYIIFMVLVMWLASKYIKTYERIALTIIFIILLLIPTWDYILGKQVFDEYCKNEAGLHIYGDIQKVDSIYVESATPYFYLDRYQFIEGKEKNKYYKYFIDINTSNNCTDGCYTCNKLLESGKCFAKVKIEKPVSFYAVFNITGYISPSHKSEQVSQFVNVKKYNSPILYELKTGEKIAEIVNYGWDNGWFMQMSGFFRGVLCRSKSGTNNELILKTTKDEK